jgi:hypothetical protein
MLSYLNRACVVLSLALLVACGSSNDNDDDAPPTSGAEPPPAPAPGRGSVIQSLRVASVTSSDLFATLSAGSAGQEVLKLITAPKCGIDVHQLQYYTVDPVGQSCRPAVM